MSEKFSSGLKNKQTNKQKCSHKPLQSGLVTCIYTGTHFKQKCANPVVYLYAGTYYYNKHVNNQDSVAGSRKVS